jgi:hypothetical protein
VSAERLLFDFISRHGLAVMATCAPGQRPECALVAYAARGGDLVVVTSADSRKYANLRQNPRVALVIGLEGPSTLQYEGEATEPAGEEARALGALVLARHPTTAVFLSADARTIVVRPGWMRLTEYTRVPPGVVEVRFGPLGGEGD